MRNLLLVAAMLSLGATLAHAQAHAQALTLTPRSHHLRAGESREWDSFPEQAESESLSLTFRSETNAEPATLWIRQQNVKWRWAVKLNGKRLARLAEDEADLTVAHTLPPGALRDGDNTLVIEPESKRTDDVRVGPVRLDRRPPQRVLGEASLDVAVTEHDAAVPCRLTVLDAHGSRLSLGAASTDRLAVRPGVVYSLDGRARFGVPAGTYRLVAGRGFEYSIDQKTLKVGAGDTASLKLRIRREVQTPGWIACDTHVHTLTHSGHGDASATERMITLAGEGIELAVASEHNKHVDYAEEARRIGAARHFTTVVGNEVTTRVGHFNCFPMPADGEVPDAKLPRWDLIFDSIRERAPGARLRILNHGRDVHFNFRPFGAERFNAVTGRFRDGWRLEANAMEVVNSAATLSEPLRLAHDWMALLGAGRDITPIGCSDSHNVASYIVGQGRTYVPVPDDADPAAIDAAAAFEAMATGRVAVSYGLLIDLKIDRTHGPGDLVRSPPNELRVAVQIRGPSWAKADRVTLFANGRPVRQTAIRPETRRGDVLHQDLWFLPTPEHDVFYTAIATGPGIAEPFWNMAWPYQQTSTHFEPRSIAVSGAIRVDGDGDGRFSSARAYALKLIEQTGGDTDALAQELGRFDPTVAAHAAEQLQLGGGDVTKLLEWLEHHKRPEALARSIRDYLDAEPKPAP